jgi:hypothetical protein
MAYIITYGLLIISIIALYYILKYLKTQITLLKFGYRTMASIIKLETNKNPHNKEISQNPVIQFKSHYGTEIKYLWKDYFIEGNDGGHIESQIKIIYDKNDYTKMKDLNQVKGNIFTYCIVAIFPLGYLLTYIFNILFY